ncbi:MAG: hypothetical protein ACPG6R_11235 [Aequoribacter sp.]|uniref:hypothetical protein n=1 Tax=Aequoribacter sp. TaxID=2847771 RepID=UPI003C634E05
MKIVIPIGGIGNRLRMLSSVHNAGVRSICYINIRSDALNACPSVYVNFDHFERVSIINLPKLPDKLIRRLLGGATQLIYYFSLGKLAAPYNIRSTSGAAFIICTCHEFKSGVKTAADFFPRAASDEGFKRSLSLEPARYNAMHIRLGDNKRAASRFDIEIYRNFIEESLIPVYVATDNAELKARFVNDFPEKIFVSDLVPERGTELGIAQAVAELQFLKGADNFLGSAQSSFSRLVYLLRGDSIE